MENKTFLIGWSSEEISAELRDRIDDAQKFLMSEPIKTNIQNKKTNSWKPIIRSKNK